jgi:hypothetical protein
LHFAAKSNRAELVPMLLRFGADVTCLCTLDGSPSAPQMTALEVAKHFGSVQCVEVLEKTAQRLASPASDAEKPAVSSTSSGRIRRTQGAADVKKASPGAIVVTAVAATAAGTSSPRGKDDVNSVPKSAGYEVLPKGPNSRSAPGYQAAPAPGHQGAALPNKKDVSLRPAAPLPVLAEAPASQYDNVPKELRLEEPIAEYDDVPNELAAVAALAKARKVSQPVVPLPEIDESDYATPPPPSVPESQYDNVPTELRGSSSEKVNNKRLSRNEADGHYGVPPPPRAGYGSTPGAPPSSTYGVPPPASSSGYGSTPSGPKSAGSGYAAVSVALPESTDHYQKPPPPAAHYAKAPVPLGSGGTLMTPMTVAGGEYTRAPAPLRAAGGHEELDNQYDSIPSELVPPGVVSKLQQQQQLQQHQQQAMRQSPMRANTNPVLPGGAVHPVKPPRTASTAAIVDDAASADINVAMSSQRIKKHYRQFSRQEAENYLRGKPANTFVLRPTTQKDGLLTLSFVHPHNGTVQHALIFHREGGLMFDQQFGCPPAASLLDLLVWQKLTV